MNIKKVIDETSLSLKFYANAIVEGFIAGQHKSPYHGFSVEFSDHKAYSRGDPVDLIDWKLFSRTDKYYTKRYEAETNVRTYFLLDCSNSMSFKSNNITKIEYAKLLVACLINLSLRQRDATGLSLFNESLITSIPAKSKSNWLNQCLGILEHIKCSGETDISNAIFTLGETIKKRSLVVIITDFLDDIDRLTKALNYLKFNKHHCVLLHIVDETEKSFNFKEESDFIDLETKEVLKVSPWIIKKDYLERYEMFHVKLKRVIEDLKYEYCQINTKTPIVDSLKLFLLNRR